MNHKMLHIELQLLRAYLTLYFPQPPYIHKNWRSLLVSEHLLSAHGNPANEGLIILWREGSSTWKSGWPWKPAYLSHVLMERQTWEWSINNIISVAGCSMQSTDICAVAYPFVSQLLSITGYVLRGSTFPAPPPFSSLFALWETPTCPSRPS